MISAFLAEEHTIGIDTLCTKASMVGHRACIDPSQYYPIQLLYCFWIGYFPAPFVSLLSSPVLALPVSDGSSDHGPRQIFCRI